jgi:Phytanoyl-CoA dioxygenase (PhyH)
LIAGWIDRLLGRKPVFSAALDQCPAMRRALANYGCFVLRGLFDPKALARIRERAVSLARTFDDKIERGDTADIANYVASPAFRAGHLPETLIGADETWSDLKTGSLFDDIGQKVFGGCGSGYALRRSVLRGSQNPVKFHQDATFLGHTPTYNFWTPLQDVGIDAPSLEVVMRSGNPVISVAYDKEETPAYVERTYGRESFWTPVLQAGDALVFTSMMFHRTQTGPHMTKTRYSLELRGAITDRTLAIAGVPKDWSKIRTQDIPA